MRFYFIFQSYPEGSTTLHFEFYADQSQSSTDTSSNSKSSSMTTIHLNNIQFMNKGPSFIMEDLLSVYKVPVEKQVSFPSFSLPYCYCTDLWAFALSVCMFTYFWRLGSSCLLDHSHYCSVLLPATSYFASTRLVNSGTLFLFLYFLLWLIHLWRQCFGDIE